MTRASIILCTRNRCNQLSLTLQSLAEIDVPEDWTVELLLVDNGSSDGTTDLLRSFKHNHMAVRVLHEARPGKSRALNRAIREATGEIYLFTDDDVRVPREWLENLCRPILDGRADVVAGAVTLAPEFYASGLGASHRMWLASTEGLSRESPEHLIGANMAIAARVLETIQGFDEELGGGALGIGEDTLFGWQVEAAGYEIVFAPDARIEHHPDPARVSRHAFCEMARARGRSEAHINYHWLGKNSWNRTVIGGGILIRALRLLLSRVRNIRGIIAGDVPSIEELDRIRLLSRAVQHWKEYGREPKYAGGSFTYSASGQNNVPHSESGQ